MYFVSFVILFWTSYYKSLKAYPVCLYVYAFWLIRNTFILFHFIGQWCNDAFMCPYFSCLNALNFIVALYAPIFNKMHFLLIDTTNHHISNSPHIAFSLEGTIQFNSVPVVFSVESLTKPQ